MFTDTKNIANASSNSDAGNAKSNAKSKGKFRHLWRLITLQKNSKRRMSSSVAHPNNVNLNNSTPTNEPVQELTSIQLEDYIASVQKMTGMKVDLGKPQRMPTENDDEETIEFMKVISSASIEKCTTTGVNCVYGRNCQHNHKTSYHSIESCDSIIAQNCMPIIEFPATSDALEQMPVQYVETDDGTFFWTLSHDKTDDDLLNAWLCQGLQQLPVEASHIY